MIAVLSRTELSELPRRFLTIKDRVELHAKIYFRGVKCWNRKADLVAECLGIAWNWFVRLHQQGKDACCFPSVLASYAARAVKSGRKVCGMVKAKDVMNDLTQQKRGFVVGKLPDFSTLDTNPLQEALTDNTVSPVIDQVQFRVDFPSWRRTRSRRDRRIIHDMALGERTMTLAKRHQLSAARVSQLRREFKEDYDRFCDSEPTEAA